MTTSATSDFKTSDVEETVIKGPGVRNANPLPDPGSPQAPTRHGNRPDAGMVRRALASQCGCEYGRGARVLGLVTPLLLCWLLLVVVLGREALPGGGLFTLVVLVLAAQLVGEITHLVGLPPLLGMLLTGIAARTTDLYNITGVYEDIVSILREASLGVILLSAGLGLDPAALRRLSFTVLMLAVCPGLMEAVTVAVTTHFFLGYPWLWGFSLGFLLCAITPAVVVPTLLKLKKDGYGEGKGISTLVIAASSIDDVLAISVFSICISMIFSTGDSLVMQMLQGPLDMCVGLSVGCILGLLVGFTPHLDDEYLVSKRAVMVGCTGLCAVLGSPYIGYPGAGPLAAITTAFVASVIWGTQGWTPSSNPVEAVINTVWDVFEPVLFALIGADIDLKQMQLETVAWGLLIISTALVIRVITCSLVLVGGKFNFKEVVFVNLAWLPKATVQAALAPQVLDMARKASPPVEADLRRGQELLTIAVLSILVTAPLGAVGASVAGPRLLAKEQTPLPPQESQQSTSAI